MMPEIGPTGPCGMWLHVFIVCMNVFQSIALALIGSRAVRKNREDRRANGDKDSLR